MSLSVTRRQKLSRTPDPRFNRDDGKVVTPVMASLRERCSWKGTRDSCRPASRHRVFDERPRRTQILIANSEIPSSFQCQPNLEYFVSNFVPRSNSRWRLNPKQERNLWRELGNYSIVTRDLFGIYFLRRQKEIRFISSDLFARKEGIVLDRKVNDLLSPI